MLLGNNTIEQQKLDEMKRHNTVIEQESQLKLRKCTHEYTMQILKDFNELKASGMEVADIVAIFPDMQKFDDR